MIRAFPKFNQEQYEIAISTLNLELYQKVLNPLDNAAWFVYPWYVFSEEYTSLLSDLDEYEVRCKYISPATHLLSITDDDTPKTYSFSKEYCALLLERAKSAELPNEFARKTFEMLLNLGMQPPNLLLMQVGD